MLQRSKKLQLVTNQEAVGDRCEEKGEKADRQQRGAGIDTENIVGNNAHMTARERVAQLIKAWPKIYPGAHCELDFKNPLELLIATILSAQCTDKRVNMVTPALFKKYRTAKDYAAATPSELENVIRSTGFFRNKAKSIRAATSTIAEKFGGKVPSTMDELRTLPGVGRKTANVVLGNAFGKNEGIVVDTHVARLSQRLGLTKQKDPNKIEGDLMKLVPCEHWTNWSHWLIWHGRRRCFARKPDCSDCEVFKLCPSGKKFLRTGEARPPNLKRS
jgi:endonuclease-3